MSNEKETYAKRKQAMRVADHNICANYSTFHGEEEKYKKAYERFKRKPYCIKKGDDSDGDQAR